MKTLAPNTEEIKKHNLNSSGKADMVLPHLVFPKGKPGSASCPLPFPETGSPLFAKEMLTHHHAVIKKASVASFLQPAFI